MAEVWTCLLWCCSLACWPLHYVDFPLRIKTVFMEIFAHRHLIEKRYLISFDVYLYLKQQNVKLDPSFDNEYLLIITYSYQYNWSFGDFHSIMAIVMGEWTLLSEFKSWMRLFTFHVVQIPLGEERIQLFSLLLWIKSRAD